MVLANGRVLRLVIYGDNLSKYATFELDHERIPRIQMKLVSDTPEPQDPKLCSELVVDLESVAARYFDGPHLLSIVNRDSQRAELKYGATIDSVSRVTDEPGKFLVTGSNFRDPSTAQWFDSEISVQPIKIPVDNVIKKSGTELVVTIGGAADPAKLSIISPTGLKTTFDLLLGKQVDTPTPPAAPPPAEPPADKAETGENQ